MTLLVDSHCHLDMLDTSGNGNSIDGILEAAREQGVCHMLCVAVNLLDFPGILHYAKTYIDVTVSVGLHPNERNEHEPTINDLVQLAQDPLVVAIGETGLDYYRSEGDTQWQRDRFRRHIRAAKEVNKPLIVHSRMAREDTLRILREESADKVGGVLHCFTDNWDMAREAMEMGFYISFSGIVTFKNATELQTIAKNVPLERMLIETDSPYLAPMPYRGKPNQPAYVRQVAEFLAQLRDIPLQQLAEQTTKNFFQLFPCHEAGKPNPFHT